MPPHDRISYKYRIALNTMVKGAKRQLSEKVDADIIL